jgi:ABC-2 type transport system ATP-binding protein
VMKNGALLTMATPEALLRTCEGNVWQSVVSSEQFDQLRTTLKISSAVRKPDGVHIRFVGPSPAIAATAAEPELEDAFLYLMNFGNAQPPAA